MKKTKLLALAMLALLPACAQLGTVPVATQCPPPPPVPVVLQAKPASTEPSLSERFETIWQEFVDSLTKAAR